MFAVHQPTNFIHCLKYSRIIIRGLSDACLLIGGHPGIAIRENLCKRPHIDGDFFVNSDYMGIVYVL